MANRITIKALGGLAAVSAAVPALAVTGAVTISAIGQQSTAAELPSPDAPDAAAMRALKDAITAQIGTLPPAANVEDLEAAIVFVIDQTQHPGDVIMAVLYDIAATDPSENVRQAAANVAALRRRLGFLEGTGSIAGIGDGLSTGPSGGGVGGGGSSDYTPTS